MMAIPFTQLSPNGTPGGFRGFAPKVPAGSRGSQQFTQLSVMATPGPVRSFLPKTGSIIDLDPDTISVDSRNVTLTAAPRLFAFPSIDPRS